MKTNEVKACVTQQLRRLQVLPEPQRRAELAELRRGVGRQPGDLPALWGALLADMPEQSFTVGTGLEELAQPMPLNTMLAVLEKAVEEKLSGNEV